LSSAIFYEAVLVLIQWISEVLVSVTAYRRLQGQIGLLFVGFIRELRANVSSKLRSGEVGEQYLEGHELINV